MKRQDYNLAHNFGHGDQWLSMTLASMMMLVFLMDQVQERCCSVFQAALRGRRTRVSLWDDMQGFARHEYAPNWAEFMAFLVGHPLRAPPPV